MEAVGIKETKLLIEAVLKLGILVLPLAKDGLQVADLPALFLKVQEKPEMLAAFSELQGHFMEIPAELKDFSLPEGIELAVDLAAYVPQVLAALKA